MILKKLIDSKNHQDQGYFVICYGLILWKMMKAHKIQKIKYLNPMKLEDVLTFLELMLLEIFWKKII